MSDLVVPRDLHRNAPSVDPSEAVAEAEWLIAHMCGHVGVADLGQLDVLDFGCGVRFTQAFLNRGVPIGHYVGVDVSRDVIEFLRAEVDDPRIEHYHLDAHNDLYNPNGRPLAELTVPEIEGREFDLICLFSVFTHLAPDDYVSMLRLLRRFVKPGGRLFFTVFLNEPSAGGYGYVDRLTAGLASADVVGRLAETLTSAPELIGAPVPDFIDVDPSIPLRIALYRREYALGLMDGTGWDVLEVAPPDVHLQHHVICVPHLQP